MKKALLTFAAFAAMALTSSSALAEQVWQTHPVTRTYSGINQVAVGDFDQDGRVDIVTTQGSGNFIAWWKNTADGVVFGNTVTSSMVAPLCVGVADIDHANGPDIVACRATEIAWFANQGNGTFSKTALDLAATNITSVKIVDLDGDGDLDIVAADSGGNQVIWYQNDGAQTFTRHTVAVPSGLTYLEIGDLNSDGRLDIAAVGASGTLVWLKNDGAQNFTLITAATGLSTPTSVGIGDLDRDARPDLVVAADNSNHGLTWLRNEGSGDTFTARALRNSDVNYTDCLLADLNRDGRQDIVAFSEINFHAVEWWENLGGGTFAQHQIANLIDDNDNRLAVADLNNDGNLEIIGTTRNTNHWEADLYWMDSVSVPLLQIVNLLPTSTAYGTLRLDGTTLYMGQSFHAEVDTFDVSDPERPNLLSRFDHASGDSANPARWLTPHNGYLYVSNVEENLITILDVRQREHPSRVGQYQLRNNPAGTVTVGNLLYATDMSGYFYVADITDPLHVTPVAETFFNGEDSGFNIVGNYAYVCNREGYFTVVDISTPAHPVWVTSLTLTAQIMEATLDGHYAYLASGHDGLQIVDIADPAHPVLVSTTILPGFAHHAVVKNGKAYLATSDGDWNDDILYGLYELDVTAPSKPLLTRATTWRAEQGGDLNMGVRYLAVSGSYLYAAYMGRGLMVVSLAPGEHPGMVDKKVNEVIAYPNPAKGTAYFMLQEPNADKAKVEIYNLAGERISSVTADHPGRILSWALDKIAAGVYVYKITLTVGGQEKKLAPQKIAIRK